MLARDYNPTLAYLSAAQIDAMTNFEAEETLCELTGRRLKNDAAKVALRESALEQQTILADLEASLDKFDD